jgi:RNA polymerase sigma-70 factor (ECF subfamily)
MVVTKLHDIASTLCNMQTQTYERLYNSYHDRVYRLALRITQNTALAEDVAQEVHIKCWKNRSKLEEVASPGAWIMRVARNLAIDKLRSHRNNTELDKVAYSAPSRDPTPDRAAEVSNMMQILRSLIETLPIKQREIFQLRELEGMKYQEIGEILEVSVDEVKVSLFRARKKIREKLLNVDRYGLSSANRETA